MTAVPISIVTSTTGSARAETLSHAERGQDRRTEILAAARELMLTEGYDRTSMRNIAAKLNVTPTTLYLYFRNKEELVYNLVQETFGILLENLQSVMCPVTDPLCALRKGLEAYIRFGLAYPDHYRVVFMTLPPEAKRDVCQKKQEECCDSLCEQAYGSLEKGVARCQASGQLRAGDAAAITATLWASVHGLATLLIKSGGHPAASPELMIETLLDTLLRGLAPEPTLTH
ncbi:MAG: TetR/AcrR family transcriptional regulator [Elstera sp.]|uniref:TetR/AcrR family transcriptional regulator n=1 Tax=Elstera sp. TaxID=1916664 RepID=UPI0037C0CA85